MTTVLLSSVLDLQNLDRMISERYIEVKKHPVEDLYILDYSRRAQYAQMWNEETMICRGLIVRAPDGVTAPTTTVHARPFRKFFNIEQHAALADPRLQSSDRPVFTPGPLPSDEPFEVFAKADGSLGILSIIEGQPTVTTRGSFSSEQALWATEFYREHYADVPVPEGVTYLFEIVGRQNRIVVDYGDFKGLILLGAVDIATGQDVPAVSWPGPVIERAEFENLDALVKFVGSNPESYYNSEGFVVRFASGVRTKMKFAEYVRLHKIVTGISNKTVYQHLGVARMRAKHADWEIAYALKMDPKDVTTLRAVPDPVGSIIEEAPDEMYDWLAVTLKTLEDKVAALESEARALLGTLPTDDRKAAAAMLSAAKPTKLIRTVVFLMLDGHGHLGPIFSAIRPTYSQAFRTDADS